MKKTPNFFMIKKFGKKIKNEEDNKWINLDLMRTKKDVFEKESEEQENLST